MSQAIRKLEKGNKVEQDLLFKDGNRNISLNQLQTNANQNLQSYLDSKSWGRRKRQAFMDAYSDMMSSINNGNIKERDSGRKYIDSSGRINNSQGRGFDAYGEAANFLDTIVDAMPNYTQSTTTTPEKKKFDTNGLITYFKNKAFGGKDPDLMVWQDRDQIIDQDSGKRAVTNRANYFADIIRDYSNTLSDEYDFSDTPFQDKNDLLSRLRTAETSLRDNTFNNNDLNSLTSLGIDGKLARMLFSETPYKESEESEEGIDEGEEKPITAEQYKKLGYTDEQISTIMQAQQIQEQQQKEGLVQQAQEIINNRNMEQWINSLKNKPFQSRVNLNLSTYKPAYNEKWVVDNFNRSYNKDALNWLNHELQLNYFIDPNKQRVFRGKLNNTYQHLSNNLDWAIKSRMLDNNKISENLYAIPTTLDYDRQSVIVYNPNSGQVQEVSLLNYLDSPKVQKWLSDYYYNNVAKHKEGGVLKYQSGGDFDNFYNYINNFDQIQKQKEEEKLKPIKEKAERENITLDQAKARERKLSEGLSGEDWTRIGASVLDIISAGSSYIPVYGTAVSAASGVASTLANLGADAADESVTSGQMWRNLGYGLGMDAIGLIPGLGTSAKAAKVARVLRPVSKALVRALQVSTIKDAVSAVPSIQKVISNPKDATTEDLRKISVGIQALLGAHRGQVGINTNNKYTSDITTNILTTKSGKNAKISVDQLKELKKKKGYDEQNEYFKSITEGQELPKEFKHYNDNWFKRPFTYLFRSGPEVEVQREVKLLPGVEYSKWGIYRKTNQNNKKKTNQTSKQTPKQKPKLSSQQIQRLESLGYTKLTPQDIKIINHHRQSKKKKKTSRDDKVTRKQQGGVLDLTKIKKFQNAGKITLNNGVVDWDSLSDPKKDILWPGSAEYSKSPLSKYVVPRLGTSSGVNNVSKSQNYSFDTNSRLKSMIDRLKNNTISPDNISEMQRRHWGMYYTWQPQDTPIYKEQVANYQTDYQNLGLNNEIIAPGYSNNYIINSPNPNSGDSTPNWTSDGLYSQITDDRRVLARKADYDNNLEQLKKDIEYAKQNGYEYYLDPETDYYMLRPIKTNDTPKDPSRDLSKNNSSVRATSYSNPIRGWIKQLGLQTPDFILAGRLFGNILNNNTVSEETLKGLKPLLVDTYNLQKYVVGDLPTKQAFYGKAAQLENLASKPRTSDASLQLAGQLEANNRGNEIRLQGDLQDNNMIKTTRDQAWQIEADNIARRSAVANKNRESLLGINKAKHDINAARRSANWVSIENFLKEKEQKELKRQELQRNFDINQLQDNIQYEQLTDPVYISLKNKAISDNATPQQINEFQKYQTLMGQRYKNRLNNAYARLYNLRTTNGYVPLLKS